MALLTDAGDRARASDLETRQKEALTQGAAPEFTPPLMTAAQYAEPAGLAANLNKGQAAALFSSLRAQPMRLPGYQVATVPNPADHLGALIYVFNGAAGAPIVAFSDGANWLRVDTGTVIS